MIVMGVRIDSRFVTTDETAKILGVSHRRVRELKKLIEADKIPATARRAISALTRKRMKKAFARFKSDSRSAKNGSPNRSKTRRGTKKRGKKTKATR